MDIVKELAQLELGHITMAATEFVQLSILPMMHVFNLVLLAQHSKVLFVNHLPKVALLEAFSKPLLIHAKAATILVVPAH